MNLPTKITIVRLVLTVVLIILLCFPFYSVGVQFPTYNILGGVSLQYIINPHYLSNSNWHNIFDKALAQKENAIEWNKQSKSILLTSIDKQTLQNFLKIYQSELQEFNTIYEESVQTAKDLNIYQKKLK